MIEFGHTENGHLHTELILKTWKGTRDASGGYAAPRKAESNGRVDIVLELRDEDAVTDAEKAHAQSSAAYLIEHETRISEALTAFLYEEYIAIRTRLWDWDGLAQERDRAIPALGSSMDIGRVVGLSTIYILPAQPESPPYFGFLMGCTWDGEHGLGVVMRGTEPVKIGSADIAFDNFIPENDVMARNLETILKSQNVPSDLFASRQRSIWDHAPWRDGPTPDLGIYDEEGRLAAAVDIEYVGLAGC